eukprot:1281990-Pyramimonas_sp.AAC.1
MLFVSYSYLLWGVECTLAVIGTGGPVKRSSSVYNIFSLGCRVHPRRYWHRRTRETKRYYSYIRTFGAGGARLLRGVDVAPDPHSAVAAKDD